jgi:transporter family-2 protein
MQTILLVILIGLVSGAAIGMQSPMANVISQRVGVLESVVIVHLGGAVAGMLVLLVTLRGVGNLGQLRELPWYLLGAGAFGLIVIAAFSYTIPRVGVMASVLITVTGQMAISSVLDHYGFLGAEVRPMTVPRLLGVAVMFLGVWLTVRE